MVFVAEIVHRLFQLTILVVIIQAILTFFVPPYHKIRQLIDRIVNPMLAPIRRFVRPMGGLDFSPLILIVLLEILDAFITRLLISL
ncbi:MAG: YggT family protein [Anaerolineales bacterium]|nr:YggT family protein [Anaerolineales bacterium]